MYCSILEHYLAACTATFWNKHRNTVYICEAHILQVPYCKITEDGKKQ